MLDESFPNDGIDHAEEESIIPVTQGYVEQHFSDRLKESMKKEEFVIDIGRKSLKAAGLMTNGARAELMSGMHARIQRNFGEKRIYVVDSDSTNGTFVNDEKLDKGEKRYLELGD